MVDYVMLARAAGWVALVVISVYLYDLSRRLMIRRLAEVCTQQHHQQGQQVSEPVEGVGVDEACYPKNEDIGQVDPPPQRRTELYYFEHFAIMWKVFLTMLFADPGRFIDSLTRNDSTDESSVLAYLSLLSKIFEFFVIFLVWKNDIYFPALTNYESYRLRFCLLASVLAENCAVVLLFWARCTSGECPSSNDDDDDKYNDGSYNGYIVVSAVLGGLALLVAGGIVTADRYMHQFLHASPAPAHDPNGAFDFGLMDAPVQAPDLNLGKVFRPIVFALTAVGSIIFVGVTIVVIAHCALNGTCSEHRGAY